MTGSHRTALRDTTTGLLDRATAAGIDISTGWSGSVWAALASAGLNRIGQPEADGGSGGDWHDAAVAVRAAAGRAAAVPLAETLFGVVPAGRLIGVSPPDGMWSSATFAASSDVVATPDASGWRLRGTVRRVPLAAHAGGVVIRAALDSSGRHLVALCPLEQLQLVTGTNVAGEPRPDVELDDVSVPRELAGEVSDEAVGWLADLAPLARSLQIAAGLDACLDLAVRYSRERTQFGRPIARFQAVQHMIAELAEEAALTSASVDAALGSLDAEHRSFAVAAAKARAGQAAGHASRLAHQVHGAIGFTQEHRLHLFTTRLWSWRDECGAETTWQRELGRRALDVGADGVWALLSAQPD